MAIIYYTTKKNEEAFDFLCCEDEYQRVKKVVSQCYILPALQEVLQYNNGLYDIIAFDLDAIKDNVNEITRQFSQYKTTERIVIYAEGKGKGEKVINDLINIGFYNIITGTQINEIREQIKVCASIEGMSYADLSHYLNGDNALDDDKENDRFTLAHKIKNSNISIIGTAPNVGTTTICYNLLSFLRELGIKCAYCAKEDMELYSLEQFMNIENPNFIQRDAFFEYRDIHFYKQGQRLKEDYDFIVYDLGCITNVEEVGVFGNDDFVKKILVSGSKPWELEEVQKLMPHLSCDKVDLLLQFANLNNSSQIRNLFKNDFKNVNLTDYTPDFFDSEKNRDVWHQLFKELITEQYSQGEGTVAKELINQTQVNTKKEKGPFKKWHHRKNK